MRVSLLAGIDGEERKKDVCQRTDRHRVHERADAHRSAEDETRGDDGEFDGGAYDTYGMTSCCETRS